MQIEIKNGVIIGRDDYLFLADGGHRIFDIITGKIDIEKISYENFYNNITVRKMMSGNAKYMHVIFPDKQTVMSDYLPISDPISLGLNYLDRCSALKDDIFFPLDLLKDMGKPTFQKTDTHMTDQGVLRVATRLAELLMNSDHSADLINIENESFRETLVTGDLGSRFDPPKCTMENVIHPNWKSVSYSNNLIKGNNGIVDIHLSLNPIYDLRVLLFGDSFGRSLSKLLTYYFREVVFLRTAYFHEDVFLNISPDIVISENVERYLDYCDSDENRPSFFMYPYLNNVECAPSVDFAEAFSAVLSYPRRPYQLWKERVFKESNWIDKSLP